MTIELVNSSGLFTVGENNYLKIRDELKDLLGLSVLEKYILIGTPGMEKFSRKELSKYLV
jgi:hypothetical protein